MTPLDPLGFPPRFALRRGVRPTFRVEFEYDGQTYDGGEDGFVPFRRVAAKTFFSERAAYRWLARRMIFARRDVRCGTGVDDGPTCECRYHEERSFRRLEDRLSRWLRWRDRCVQAVVSRETGAQ